MPTRKGLLHCRQELVTWPQYAKRIVRGAGGRAAIHLDVFGYYAFWTAFYVLRGSQTAAPSRSRLSQGRLAYSHLAPGLGTVLKACPCGFLQLSCCHASHLSLASACLLALLHTICATVQPHCWPLCDLSVKIHTLSRRETYLIGKLCYWMVYHCLRAAQTMIQLHCSPTQLPSWSQSACCCVVQTLRLGAGNALTGDSHAYLRLLYMYLEQYLPRTAQDKASNAASGRQMALHCWPLPPAWRQYIQPCLRHGRSSTPMLCPSA